ncbi:glycine betaine/L-proline ABC transporter ATP-binding protein [Photobacterium sp. 1_MG-2023]|uniref:quaternary amine ABC transporter ATP-binding protein n=1 Tax=Photobacterium sp. 1_MG-2023 TaxID=3062646 RepID=UPI0026E1EC48|nr:glycine betaine/L-proline ABC transporter ATP-binding protein [Photobacterium sp. 1_MG-2023]MDO6706567.1 glycine betaine/L-proline ABC transporter ATP-binding protein [Photobacterium sp. 1_MG-2023]
MTDPSIRHDDRKPLIQVRGLYKVFGPRAEQVMSQVLAGTSKETILAETGHTVGLNDINLSVYPGEIFVVMGLSGSGKSTLIRLFNRLIEPTAGQVDIDDVQVTTLSSAALQTFRRQRMAMVFQRFALLPHRTVLQNIGYGLQIQKHSQQDWLKKAQYWLETVGLSGYGDHYPSSLSGGQQQRVGLARALCTDADILLMDEAFSALDPLIRSEMQSQLMSLQSELGKTIIFITHDLDEALRLGDRIAILRDGVLVQQGRPVDILLRPADDYVEAFVRDVNLARALTVGSVMSREIHQLGLVTPEDAAHALKANQQVYSYIWDEQQGYLGVLTEVKLRSQPHPLFNGGSLVDLLESVPAIRAHQLLEDVLPATLNSNWPLPVLDSEGRLRGCLSRSILAKVLSEHRIGASDG